MSGFVRRGQQQPDTIKIPDGVDPETRIFFSLFRDGPEIEINAAKKRLRGAGVTVEELIENGWVIPIRKDGIRLVEIANPLIRWNGLSRKKELKSDLDQVHFAINCCIGGKTYKDKPADWELWISENYKSLLPSVGAILKFIEINHFGSDFKQAIGIADRTLERTLQKIKDSDGEFKKASEQMNLFDMKEK